MARIAPLAGVCMLAAGCAAAPADPQFGAPAGRARGVREDDACLEGGGCGLGLLQTARPSASRSLPEAAPAMPAVDLGLVDEFLLELSHAPAFAPSMDPVDGCPPGFEANYTVKAYNYAKPGSWEPTSLCLNGPAQSPINFFSAMAVASPTHARLGCHYHAMKNCKVTNTGHNLEVIGKFGTLTLPDGRTYEAHQFHVHSPSEHTVDLKHSAMELHMVHVNSAAEKEEERYAVVGVLFDIGRSPNPCIEQMLRAVPRYGCEYPIGTVDCHACFGEQLDGPWFNYRGSFTTPPCTEGVLFNIMQRKATISLEQYFRFKRLAFPASNARPLQLLNGRVYYYEPGP